jgi:DNA-binding NarL/FixJ family response regulator
MEIGRRPCCIAKREAGAMANGTPLQCLDWWLEASLCGGDWRDPLDRTAAALGAEAMVLICRDLIAKSTIVSMSSDAPVEFVLHCRSLAGERFARPRQMHARGLGNIAAASAMAGSPSRRQCVTVLALHYLKSDPAPLQAVAAIAASSATARQRVEAMQTESALKSAALDQSAFGVVIVDERLRAVDMNQSCRAMIARSDGLGLVQDRLLCRDRGDQATLATAVAAVLNGELEAPVVRIRRASGAEPYVARAICAKAPPHAERKCLLTIADPDGAPPLAGELWRAMFDLTDCELAIAEGMVAGRKIVDIAGQRGVSVETVRTQTKRMFERLNVSSQVEAVARLSRAAPFRAAEAAG